MFNPARPGKILKELIIDTLGLTIRGAENYFDISGKTLSKVLSARVLLRLKWLCV